MVAAEVNFHKSTCIGYETYQLHSNGANHNSLNAETNLRLLYISPANTELHGGRTEHFGELNYGS